MSKSTTPISFIENYQLEKFEQCITIKPIDRAPTQPDFIDQFEVNGRPVSFLGHLKFGNSYTELIGKWLEIKTMVIPKYSTFINTDILREYLRSTSTPKDGAIIPVLRRDKIEKSIVLRTCVSIQEEEERFFHFCDNYNDISPDEEGDSTCCTPARSIYFDSEKGMQYGLLPFYISWEDIEKGYKKDKHWILKNRLIEYFDCYGKMLHNDVNPINKHRIAGVFLLPRIQVDQSIIYLCLLNQPSETYKYSIKETLSYWFEQFDKFNTDPKIQELAMKGNDLFLCNIEQWSIKIGCDATPIVKDKKKPEPKLKPLPI